MGWFVRRIALLTLQASSATLMNTSTLGAFTALNTHGTGLFVKCSFMMPCLIISCIILDAGNNPEEVSVW